VCSSHKAYRPGAFDFLAAYVVLEDAWYIIPAKLIRGLKSISLCTEGAERKYEEYREAWHLIREASGIREEASEGPLPATSARSGAPLDSDQLEGVTAAEEAPTGPGVARMKAAFGYFRKYLEKSQR